MERIAPGVGARLVTRIWFTLPAKPWPHAVPSGSTPFELSSDGATVRGRVWGDQGPVVYLVHGWGGRASQLAPFVEPLLQAGRRVVMFDGPSHGDSDPGAGGSRTTHGVELGRAFDAVAARFGPAEGVVAHSFGAMTTLLTIKYGWLSAERLVFLAPMVEFATVFDGFRRMLGFGLRTSRRAEALVSAWVGLPPEDFSVRRLMDDVGPVPTLVVHDRRDRQTSYADSADLADRLGHVSLVDAPGLGHLLLLSNPGVVRRAVDFLVQQAEVVELPVARPVPPTRRLNQAAAR